MFAIKNIAPIMRPWIFAARPKTLLIIVAPILLASSLAWHDGFFQLIPAALCLTFGILSQIGSNLANDYYDYMKGADSEGRIGFQRAVASGVIAPERMLKAVKIMFGLSFISGLGLLFYGGIPMIGVGLVCILFAYAYTGGPYPLAYLGLGEIIVFIFFGLIAIAFTYFVQAGIFSWASLWVGIGYGLLAANVLLVNNYRDLGDDMRAGKKTLSVRFGRQFSWAQYMLSGRIALITPCCLLFLGYKTAVLLPLVSFPFCTFLTYKLKNEIRGPQLNRIFVQTILFLLLYAILLSIGILLS